MPQFDISSFIVQLFWLFICFLSFYFIFSWIYLPSWALLLKTRKKPNANFNLQGLRFDDFKLNNTFKTGITKVSSKTTLWF